MKKSVLALMLGATFALTACDRPASKPETATTAAPAPESTQQVAESVDYKKLAIEKSEQAEVAAKEAQDKSVEAANWVNVGVQRREEAKAALANGDEDAQKIADQKNEEAIAADNQAVKLANESKAASAKALQLAEESRQASEKANEQAK